MVCALKMNLLRGNCSYSVIFVMCMCNVEGVMLAEFESTVTGFMLHSFNQASAHHMALCAILFWFHSKCPLGYCTSIKQEACQFDSVSGTCLEVHLAC